ncbi:MAG TPA: hypothetical protein DEB24_00185 [Coriobacteriia bacterium]|nr:hypothetical protein [Coriobacteriia bacterium]
MEDIKTIDGKVVTEKMLDKWAEELDCDEWPEGWKNVGEIIVGRPPLSVEGSAVLSVKVPVPMKRAIERKAKEEGLSTSDFVRSIIANESVHG